MRIFPFQLNFQLIIRNSFRVDSENIRLQPLKFIHADRGLCLTYKTDYFFHYALSIYLISKETRGSTSNISKTIFDEGDIIYSLSFVLFSHFLTGVRKIFLLTSEKSVLGKWLVEIWLWRQSVLFSSQFSYCDVMKKDDLAWWRCI